MADPAPLGGSPSRQNPRGASAPDPWLVQVPAPVPPPVRAVGPGHPDRLLVFDVRGNRGLGITLLVISGLVVLGKLGQAATSFAAANAVQTRAATDGLLPVPVVLYVTTWLVPLLYVPAWFVAGLWLARMHRNAVSVNPRLVQRSVLWAWFSWAIPVVSLIMPKRFVDETWVATAAALPADDPDAEVVWTGPWWTLWLLFQFLAGVSLGVGGSIARPDRTVLPALDIVVAVVGLLAYATWMRVVLGASATQVALERALRSGVVTNR